MDNTNTQTKKIYNLEFLRIVGCIAIVLLHLFNEAGFHSIYSNFPLYAKFYNMTLHGQKAVDLFFILSGFFFMLKTNFTRPILQFLGSKIKRLYPVLIFAILLTFVLSIFHLVNFNFYSATLVLFGLNGTPLVLKYNVCGQFWYCSAMLWVFLLYYHLFKNYEKKTVNLIIGVLTYHLVEKPCADYFKNKSPKTLAPVGGE